MSTPLIWVASKLKHQAQTGFPDPLQLKTHETASDSPTQSLDVTSALRYKLSSSVVKPARDGGPSGSHQLQQKGGWKGKAGEGQVRERFNLFSVRNVKGGLGQSCGLTNQYLGIGVRCWALKPGALQHKVDLCI